MDIKIISKNMLKGITWVFNGLKKRETHIQLIGRVKISDE